MSKSETRASPRTIELDEIDSTSSEAMRRASTGERGPLWIRAIRQTAGRGRSGRPWSSGDGNLAASLVFEPRCPIGSVHQLALLAGVAVHDAVSLFTTPGAAALALKWPNDLLIGPAKLGGILTESTTFDGRLIAVIGVGVNIVKAPEVGARSITRLTDHTTRIPSPRLLLTALAARFDAWLQAWNSGSGFDAIRAAWLERALPIGCPMTIQSGSGPVAGCFAGLDPTGALILSDFNGQQRRFSYGDVTLEPAKEHPR